MFAPTALKPVEASPTTDAAAAAAFSVVQEIMQESQDDNDLLLEGASSITPSFEPQNATAASDDADMELDEDMDGRPRFEAAKEAAAATRIQTRQVRIPPHRLTPLKTNWPRIYPPLVEHLKIQTRFNTKRKSVELRNSKHTTDPGALQKAEDFVKAFSLGFEIEDAIALLRLEDLYIETFEIKDVKTLQGDHLSRAIGRIAGKDGKTKFAIENATRTRIVLADSKIHILGAYKPTQIAKACVCALILGKQPGKVYNNLRGVSARMKERF
ncbi:hypothetical protein BROUX41_000191 [Berkeleyomyces rouxiae]|uniref:uncharacterized protein n=1 Tax=Berkeleyomyces rouxiae TaxID=2035830 RepID=UPI003B81BCB9